MFPSKMSIPCQNSRVSPVTAMFHAPVPCWKAPQSQKNAPGPSEALWPGRTWSTAPIGRAPRPRPCPAPPHAPWGAKKMQGFQMFTSYVINRWLDGLDQLSTLSFMLKPSPSRPIPRYIGPKRNQVNGSTAKVDLQTKAKREATQVRMERCWICYNIYLPLHVIQYHVYYMHMILNIYTLYKLYHMIHI